MVKDWFSHGRGDPQRAWELDIDESDPWPQRPFRILKTMADPTRMPGDDGPQTFVSTETHWWDGSQIYGSTPEQQHERRSHDEGKLWIDSKGLLMLPDDPKRNPAMVPGWWIGLNMMSTVFVREHNAICDRLQAEYPNWSDEQLFRRARLVVSALMAKIHTAEWTPAIIAHPTTIVGLKSEWWGLAGERVRRRAGVQDRVGLHPGQHLEGRADALEKREGAEDTIAGHLVRSVDTHEGPFSRRWATRPAGSVSVSN